MSVDATSIRESLFQRIASYPSKGHVTHPKMWGTICIHTYVKSKMRRFPKALRNFLLKIFWELKFGSWWLDGDLYWMTNFEIEPQARCVREREKKWAAGEGCWSLKVSCCLWVSLSVHCEEHEVHMKFTMSNPMMCSWGSYWNFMDLQWFFQRIFWIFWQFHIGFYPVDSQLWKWNMMAKNSPLQKFTLSNTCSYYANLFICLKNAGVFPFFPQTVYCWGS